MSSKRFLLLGLLFVGLAGCAKTDAASVGSDPGSTPGILPYRTATSVFAGSGAALAPSPTPPPLPSPTPFMYTVVENDTMIAIAVRFGITLDELQVANPEANPNLLSLGTQLVIPLSFEEQEESTDSAVVLDEGAVECFPIRTGGVRCYWLVTNTLEEPVENISGVIRLYDNAGQLVADRSTVTFLNLLEPGMQAPLAAFFEPPVGDWQLAQGQILTAVTVNQYEERYLEGQIDRLRVEIAEGGLQAAVSGTLALGTGETPAYLWILATAYDADGDLVGVKRWEASPDQLSDTLEFGFEVFSLGRPIEQVTLQLEARASGLPASSP